MVPLPLGTAEPGNFASSSSTATASASGGGQKYIPTATAIPMAFTEAGMPLESPVEAGTPMLAGKCVPLGVSGEVRNDSSDKSVDVWRLELCSDLRPPNSFACPGCEGYFRIIRLSGCPNSAQCGCPSKSQSPAAPSRADCFSSCTPPLRVGTPIELLLDAAEEGPDELDIWLEGPEFYRLRYSHTGNCTYVAPFATSLQGTFRVGVVAVRANWDAIDEGQPRFPPYSLHEISGPKLLISLGHGSAEELRSGWERATREGLGGQHYCVNFTDSTSPGRWVSLVDPKVLLSPPAPVFLTSYLVTDVSAGAGIEVQPASPKNVYFTDLSRGLQWQPFSCIRRGPLTQSPTTAGCLGNRTMNFRGDSQLRTLYNHFMGRLVGIESAAVKGVDGPSCVNSLFPGADDWMQPGVLQNFFSCFSSVPMGEQGPPDLLSYNSREPHPSVVVLNFGQHFASQHRKTVAEYREHFLANLGSSKFFGHVKDRVSGKVPVPEDFHGFKGVIWVESQPTPRRDDQHVHNFGDWRTSPRMRLYNRVVDRELGAIRRESGLGHVLYHVPSFDLVSAVIDSSMDHAHLTPGSEALDILSERLLAIICE